MHLGLGGRKLASRLVFGEADVVLGGDGGAAEGHVAGEALHLEVGDIGDDGAVGVADHDVEAGHAGFPVAVGANLDPAEHLAGHRAEDADRAIGDRHPEAVAGIPVDQVHCPAGGEVEHGGVEDVAFVQVGLESLWQNKPGEAFAGACLGILHDAPARAEIQVGLLRGDEAVGVVLGQNGGAAGREGADIDGVGDLVDRAERAAGVQHHAFAAIGEAGAADFECHVGARGRKAGFHVAGRGFGHVEGAEEDHVAQFDRQGAARGEVGFHRQFHEAGAGHNGRAGGHAVFVDDPVVFGVEGQAAEPVAGVLGGLGQKRLGGGLPLGRRAFGVA